MSGWILLLHREASFSCIQVFGGYIDFSYLKLHYWPLILEVLSKLILSLFKKRVDLGPYACWFRRIMLAVAVNCNLLMSRQISTSGITVMFPIGFFTTFIIIGTIPLWQSPKQRDEHQSNATCSCSLFPAVRSICGSKGAQEGAF